MGKACQAICFDLFDRSGRHAKPPTEFGRDMSG